MVKEIYHTTRLGIQTGFGVIGIASSFCRRSFYYLDFFDLAILFTSVVFFGGGVLFLSICSLCFIRMSSGYVLSRDWIKGIQLHRITERTVAIFTFFSNLLRGEVIWWHTRVLQHWEARGIVRFTDHEELRLQGRRLLLINDV